ncbi:salicylate synthase [Clostridium saccharobutylicum]|uniref:MbtI: isochorismate synthase/isochorismate-pyruvate lyase MbtI n=1 Tax=Clostridium saccharobutylicum DSM 13864 TaxID=1345695 RepID=U5MQ84_CLOSA|nr:salicylate synthase [Clostridium saccharobutylicum]AGX42683.1 mbtI: isochorismate synthase/isochorismate-pyruvate lyase MbtI [Clostridium saccharobutylicum DSM 13864]AQR89975.1 isochorismate synthase/isochorismate lyase [Clostridium saccharobutylicum]AQR99880.1 isochorismate synthase/isochorismate lyase [Clostridium saccharobutylicum]AQS09608.1 isochorismate synthase/isochorismate lyase [Clostridium saccharobutylicum]AQS13864.1 isochorismate synthase/isochorismate lyase [Clostridium sacchar
MKYNEFQMNIDLKDNFDKYILATKICSEKKNVNHMLYESDDVIYVGIGEYSSIQVTEDTIVLETQSSVKQWDIKDLNIDLEIAFSEIQLEEWRAYGIANFGLAKFNYGLPLNNESNKLLKLFIPEIEYQITDESLKVRALQEKELNGISEKLKLLIEDIDNVKNTIDMKNKLEIQEIFSYDQEYYKDIVSKGVAEIKNKTYKKVILSRKIPIKENLDMELSYLVGRRANTPARSYILKFDDLQAFGFSPETVAEIDRERNVYTFPLAGTRAFFEDREKSDKLRRELLDDTKEIAEHAVSVKLADEELQQVCKMDTVVVTEFMSIMERGTVQHIGSRLRGTIKDEYNSWYAFNKLFPAVTASGIPKKESIDAIGRLEKDARDLYSGSVLIYDSNGALDAALVLRTIFQNSKETWIRAGAGIIEMSKPKREFEETCEKLSSVSKQLIKKE